jgi:hypothetical protein
MNEIMIEKLKGHVSTFSEAVKIKYDHSDTLILGGQIKRIFKLPGTINGDKVEYLDTDCVYLTLDDGVGESCVLIPREAYQMFDSIYQFKEGMLVIATGRLFDPYKKLKSHGYVPSIISWEITPIEDGD